MVIIFTLAVKIPAVPTRLVNWWSRVLGRRSTSVPPSLDDIPLNDSLPLPSLPLEVLENDEPVPGPSPGEGFDDH